MKLEVFADAAAVAQQAAAFIAQEIGTAVAARGRAAVAFSGGHTPWPMLRALAGEDVPWRQVHVFQSDERMVPPDNRDRTMTQLRDALLSHVPLPLQQVHPMPVDDADPAAAARRYGEVLAAIAGAPPVLDLIHLGLGADGHTASLVPQDSALAVNDANVALSGPYQGHRRMTLTYPMLDRARAICWLVTGADKAAVLKRLYAGDCDIPAGRVARERAAIFADRAAAQRLRQDMQEDDGQNH